MRLRDVLDPSRHAACTAHTDTRVAAVVASMTAAGRSACVVLDGDDPVGIFTAGDLLRCAQGAGLSLDLPVRQVMTGTPLVADVNDLAMPAAVEMACRGCHHLPVMDGAAVVGVLRLADIAAGVLDAMKMELRSLEGYIADLHMARED